MRNISVGDSVICAGTYGRVIAIAKGRDRAAELAVEFTDGSTAHVDFRDVAKAAKQVGTVSERLTLNGIIARLLKSSFRDYNYDFACLTTAEREIVGCQENMDEIKEFVKHYVNA